MYLLIIKDGLVTRYIGPYATTKQASDDLEFVLSSCANRASWQIHALEPTNRNAFSLKQSFVNQEASERKAS